MIKFPFPFCFCFFYFNTKQNYKGNQEQLQNKNAIVKFCNEFPILYRLQCMVILEPAATATVLL